MSELFDVDWPAFAVRLVVVLGVKLEYLCLLLVLKVLYQIIDAEFSPPLLAVFEPVFRTSAYHMLDADLD